MTSIQNEAALKDRDFTIIVDKSGSMQANDMPSGTRWKAAYETTLGLAHKCHAYDPDGLTFYAFNSNYKRHDNVTPSTIENAWKEHEPNGGTDLAKVLKDALDSFFSRKAAGKLKLNGEIIAVITDGVPDNEQLVAQYIVDATKKMDRDEELGIIFLQVGKDAAASAFLKKLDNDLTSLGAKYDIVDTKTFEEIGEMSLADVLLGAIND